MSILTEATHHRLNWLSKHCTEQGAAHGAVSFEIVTGDRYWSIRATGHPACDEWMVNPIARGQLDRTVGMDVLDAVRAWWASLADEWDDVRAEYLAFRARVALNGWKRDRATLDDLAMELFVADAQGRGRGAEAARRAIWPEMAEEARDTWRQMAAAALRWVDRQQPTFQDWMKAAAATADSSTMPAAPENEG